MGLWDRWGKKPEQPADLSPKEREQRSRRWRRKRRIDRGRFNGLSSLSSLKAAPASLYVRHGLLGVDGKLIGYVPAPAPSTGGYTPSEWLKVKATREHSYGS